MDMIIKENIFVDKLFDKSNKFPFPVIRMPHKSSNIPFSIFYGSIFSEFLRVARCTLLFEDFIPKASELFRRLENQGGKENIILKLIKKGINRYPSVFNKFDKTFEDISNEIQQHNA